MNTILQKQRSLLKRIAQNHGDLHNPSSLLHVSNECMIQYIKDQAFFLNEEVTEIMLAIGKEDRAILKPWSTRYNSIAYQEFKSTDSIRSEAIDMLCFCLNICIAVGLGPDNIEQEYNTVFQKNIHRQEHEY
jgi:NTP pyrophosphatase (non-canonical NTP hydrolase)